MRGRQQTRASALGAEQGKGVRVAGAIREGVRVAGAIRKDARVAGAIMKGVPPPEGLSALFLRPARDCLSQKRVATNYYY